MLHRVYCFVSTTTHVPEKVENPSTNVLLDAIWEELRWWQEIQKQGRKDKSPETIQILFFKYDIFK